MYARAALTFLLLAALLIPSAPAAAFCGFYVAGDESTLHNHATTVVLMREGTHTVLSMQNDYAGPPEDFAMIVPVPTVLEESDVRTLPRELFATIERLSGPRLVEYWEEDPCSPGYIGLGSLGTIGHGAGTGSGSGYGSGGGGFVRVEAEFAVGEYDIVILGTNDSSALESWLLVNHYHVPAGAAEALRPYVEAGTKFFVARVDVDRVHFEGDRAVLSPLRVHYESETFSLPVRLGLLNSAGTQDLVVAILARNQRYDLANYPNVFIPTNLEVLDGVRGRFSDFYGALFDRTLEAHPGAVVTEYSWQVTSCDPCPPDASVSETDLMTLGGDVLYREGVQSGGWGGFRGGPGAVPQIRLSPPVVGDGLSTEVVRRVTRRHMNELRFCYEQELAGLPSVAGTLEVQYDIAPSGEVAEASITPVDGTLTPRVTGCSLNAFRRWAFPAPDGGVSVHVTQRYTLSCPTCAPPTAEAAPSPLPASASSDEFVLTRLHYRYERGGLGEDLVFRRAEPVVGGRETRDAAGALEEGAIPDAINNFQARYAIRHAWEGAIACESPIRGRWGGPPSGEAPQTLAAPAHAERSPIELAALVRTAVPALGLGAALTVPAPPPPSPLPAAPFPTAPSAAVSGCGCRVGGGSPAGGWALVLPALLLGAAFFFGRR